MSADLNMVHKIDYHFAAGYCLMAGQINGGGICSFGEILYKKV